MIRLIKDRGKLNYGIKQYVVDSIDEIPSGSFGDEVFVIGNGKKYVYSSSGVAVEQPKESGGTTVLVDTNIKVFSIKPATKIISNAILCNSFSEKIISASITKK